MSEVSTIGLELAAVSLGRAQVGAIDGSILERGLVRQSDAFDRAGLEAAFAKIGTPPRFALLTPHFMALPSMLGETDLIAIVPSLLGPSFRIAGIVAGRVPYVAKPAPAKLVWHRRSTADAGHAWFRALPGPCH